MTTTPLHIETPLLQAPRLSDRLGVEVLLKMEAMQPSGSFKLRGLGHACQHHAANGVTHFVSSSGGNAGIAAAYCGQALNIPTTVVVPESTTIRAIQHIEQYQGEVVIHGTSWQEANAHAENMLDTSAVLLHPFDDPLVWQGNSSLVDELVAADVWPDAMVVAVGGGGLLAGIAAGLTRHGLDETQLICAETEGAASLHASIGADTLVELSKIDSIATSLGARQVCAQALAVTRSFHVQSVLVDDRQAASECLKFLDQHRVLVEPACGAAIAALSEADLEGLDQVVVVICGGVVNSFAQLQAMVNGMPA